MTYLAFAAVAAIPLIANVLAVPLTTLSNPDLAAQALATTGAPLSAARTSSRSLSQPLRVVIAIELEMARILTQQRFSLKAFVAAKQTAASEVAADTDEARRLDALLTACGIPRYFVTPDTGLVLGLTTHSPYQLTYGLQRAGAQHTFYFDTSSPNPFFHAKLIHDFGATPIIVTGSVNRFPFSDLIGRFAAEFTAAPPACARSYLPISGLHVYFRR